MSDFDNSVPPLPGENWERFMEYQRGEHDPSGTTADPNSASLDPYDGMPSVLPYRLAHEIQEAIQDFAATCDYTLGQADRHDMAIDLANSMNVEPADLAFEALLHWRRVYGQ